MAAHSQDVFHHVRDATVFEFPQFLGGEVQIPQPFGEYFVLTKFMILEVVAALIVFFIYRSLARRIQGGEPIRGAFWTFWETLALFIRDEVVRPVIGRGHDHDDHGHGDHAHPSTNGAHTSDEHAHDAPAKVSAEHPADKYLPFVWSVFFFVLICNLLGAIPWMGSPTGNLWVTGTLALSTLFVTIWSGSAELGSGGYWKALVPPMDVPAVLKPLLVPLLWVIEVLGLLIKHGVLAVRLFANIMAGHTVIAVILTFIGEVAMSPLVWVVAPASVFGQVAIGLLELFIAFLQAYIFAFLATLFISSAVHPH